MNSIVIVNENTAALSFDQPTSFIEISDNGSQKRQKVSKEAEITVSEVVRDAQTFLSQKWDFIKNITQTVECKPALLKRIPSAANLLHVFASYFTVTVWTLLLSVVNRNIKRGQNHTKLKWYNKCVSLKELKQFYGIVMEMESTWGNFTKALRKHHQIIKKKYSEKNFEIMGIDRFQRIRSSLVPTTLELQQLCNLLGSIFKEHVENVFVVVVDEALIGYQPTAATKERAKRRRAPIPVQFIPRKPHPNGLLLYMICTWIPNPAYPNENDENHKLPVILGFHPHLTVGDSAPHEVLIDFLEEPHVVADSAFGSVHVMEEVHRLGFTATLSMPTTGLNYLWNVLSENLPGEHWRAAVCGDFVASVHCREEDSGKITYKRILATGYKAEITLPLNTSNQRAPTGALTVPFYTKEILENMLLTELKAICSKYNITKTGTLKGDIIDSILECVKFDHIDRTELDGLLTMMESHFLTENALCHKVYCSYFNVIDLADRYWYQVAEYHANQQWTSKFLLTLLKFTVITVWTHHQTHQVLKWMTAREQIAEALILGRL